MVATGTSRAVSPTYRGMRLVRLPAPRSKYLETVVHGLFAAIHALCRRYDVIYICNSANVPAAIVLRLRSGGQSSSTWTASSGSERNGTPSGRAYYRACAWLAAHLPFQVVTDARVIQDHYRSAYGRETSYFPYGTDLGAADDDGTLARLGLEPRAVRPVRQSARAGEQRPRRDRGIWPCRERPCRW